MPWIFITNLPDAWAVALRDLWRLYEPSEQPNYWCLPLETQFSHSCILMHLKGTLAGGRVRPPRLWYSLREIQKSLRDTMSSPRGHLLAPSLRHLTDANTSAGRVFIYLFIFWGMGNEVGVFCLFNQRLKGFSAEGFGPVCAFQMDAKTLMMW